MVSSNPCVNPSPIIRIFLLLACPLEPLSALKIIPFWPVVRLECGKVIFESNIIA